MIGLTYEYSDDMRNQGGGVTDMDSAIQTWHATFVPAGRTPEDGGDFPPHSAQCLGCGPNNPHGHRLRVTRHGNVLRAPHLFDAHQEGAPGIAHGGSVTTVLDDLAGMVPYLVGEMAVTRRLTVDFHAPVRLGTPYELTSWLERREGRSLVVHAEARDREGSLVSSAVAIFLSVGTEHFRNGSIPPAQPDATTPVQPS